MKIRRRLKSPYADQVGQEARDAERALEDMLQPRVLEHKNSRRMTYSHFHLPKGSFALVIRFDGKDAGPRCARLERLLGGWS